MSARDDGERARLRAVAEKLIADKEFTSQLMGVAADVVLRLLDDVERLERAWDCAFQQALENGGKYQEQRARAERLEAAIRWALGETDDFPAREPGQGAYWWRTELSRRAALAEPAPGGQDAERAADKGA